MQTTRDSLKDLIMTQTVAMAITARCKSDGSQKDIQKFVIALSFLLLFNACSDDAVVIKYDKSLTHLACSRLVVFPADKLISDTLINLYDFNENCPYELQVSRKSAIACNSNQNADKKALSDFPSGYIRMDIYKNRKLVYSYYKDLNRRVSKDIIEEAFRRLESDMLKE